jgi:hypothetical protein
VVSNTADDDQDKSVQICGPVADMFEKKAGVEVLRGEHKTSTYLIDCVPLVTMLFLELLLLLL